MAKETQELRTHELEAGMSIRLASRRGSEGFNEYHTLTGIESLPGKKFRLSINDHYGTSDVFAGRTKWFVRDTSEDLTTEELQERVKRFSSDKKVGEKQITVTIYSRKGFDDGTCMHCYSKHVKSKAYYLVYFGKTFGVPLCETHTSPYL